MHEHLVIDLSGPKNDPDACIGTPSVMIPEVAAMVGAGGRAIVELTNTGMGRDIDRLREISSATGCHVIAATGFYQVSYHPEWLRSKTVDEIADIMVREVTCGIDGTAAKAGVIGEIGTSRSRVHPEEERVLRAAARANLRTGVPISTHCTLGTMATEQLDILESEGVELHRVAIGHLDLVDDIEYHSEVARRGAFVQYDTVGKHNYQPDDVRIRLILDMLDRGFVRQVMLSCDVTRRSHLKSSGGNGYDYLFRVFLPELMAGGLDQASVKVITNDNPARFLAF